MKGFRIASLLRKPLLFDYSLQRQARLSSSSLAAAAVATTEVSGFSSFFDGGSGNGESLVYRHKLQFQRPPKIRWKARLQNSISLIGSVQYPARTMKMSRLGVFTVLKVKASQDSDRTFRILLTMWDKMAKIALEHLKENDLIYVSGYLDSYKKVDMSGKSSTIYKVVVEELNYVTQNHKPQACKTEKEEQKAAQPISSATNPEKKPDPLYLWQIFFANPHEWWDNRKSKKSPWHPDFKHKDTGECLWMSLNDPPWVKRLLQLHDSRMAEQGFHPQRRVSQWEFDE